MAATTLVVGTYTAPMGHVPNAHATSAYAVTHDAASGAWGSIASVDLGSSPSYLATLRHPSGSVIAVAANESSHTLTSSQLLPAPHSPPECVFLGDRPACCSYPCHVAAHPSQSWVISCAYFGGVASVHPVADDEHGVLAVGPSCCTLRVTGSSGSDPDRQAAPHLHCACFSPCGNAALLCDLGADCVYVCSFSPASGELQLCSACPIGAGAGPRHLVWHPLHADVVFVANELDNSISLCRWDAAARLLSVTSSLPLLPLSCKEQCAAAAIVTSLDGRFVFVSVRGCESGPNCISRFAYERSDSGSSLQFLGTTPSLGSCPRGMAMHPLSDVLYCANQDSDSIVAFKVTGSGGLEPLGEPLAIPTPVCVAFQ